MVWPRRISFKSVETALDSLFFGGHSVRHFQRPDDEDFNAQLTDLYRRLYSIDPTDADRDADAALWEAVAAEDGPEAAWRSLLSTLLRDPTFWTY